MPVLIQIVCLTMLSVTQNIASNDRIAQIMNWRESQRRWSTLIWRQYHGTCLEVLRIYTKFG